MQIKTAVMGLTLGVFIFTLTGCVSKTEEAHIPSHSPKSAQSELKRLTPQAINLQSVKDYRAHQKGKRESLGLAMGDVVFNPQAVNVIKDVIVSEFEHAGHRFTDKDQTVTLAVKVRNFDIGTNSTATYWDINGSTKIDIEVSGKKGSSTSFSYVSACSDRTYVWPSGKLFEGVMLKCIEDFANKFRNDKALVAAMQSMDTN